MFPSLLMVIRRWELQLRRIRDSLFVSALAWLFVKFSKFECSKNICVWTNKRKRDFSNHDVTVVTTLLKLHAVCGPCSTLCLMGCAVAVQGVWRWLLMEEDSISFCSPFSFITFALSLSCGITIFSYTYY